MITENDCEKGETKALSQIDVMPSFIKLGGLRIEKPDLDGDFEIMIKDNDNVEVYKYLTTVQAQKLVDFISHFLNEA